MNKTILISGGLAILILGCLSATSFSISDRLNKEWWEQRDKDVAEYKEMKKEAEDIEKAQDYTSDGKTLGDFIKDGGSSSFICSFSQDLGGEATLFVETYVSGKKVRVDYNTSEPVKGQTDLHLLSDGDYSYIWGNSILGDAFSGMKMKLDGEETETMENTQAIDYDMEMINCREWDPEPDRFKLPQNIEFKDMEAFDPSSSDIEDNCSMCGQFPEAQRSECLKAMNCAQ